jgi:hypothetical protein
MFQHLHLSSKLLQKDVFNLLIKNNQPLVACRLGLLSSHKLVHSLSLNYINKRSTEPKWYQQYEDGNKKYSQLICLCINNGYSSKLIKSKCILEQLMNEIQLVNETHTECQFVADLCNNEEYMIAFEYIAKRVYAMPQALNILYNVLILARDYFEKQIKLLKRREMECDQEEKNRIEICIDSCERALQNIIKRFNLQ